MTPEAVDRRALQGDGFVIESARPLSDSVIFRVQRSYYELAGTDAWASGDVPQALTSGPMLARAYARLVEAYAEDCRAGAMGALDPDEPLYVIELGSGTGRLAFELLSALDPDAVAPLRVRYVATDKVPANVAAIANHPGLARYLAEGILDVACVDAASSEPVHLERAGTALRALANPAVLVTNYLFDVLPQDLFTTEGGVLSEELVTTCAQQPDLSPGEADFFRRIFLATTRREVPADRYGGGVLDELLAAAAAGRPEGRFLFPTEGLAALRNVLQLCDGRLLCLIGERPGRVPLRRPDEAAVAAAIGADPSVRPGPAAVSVGELDALRPGALLAMGVHGGSMSLPVDLSILAGANAPGNVSVLLPEAPPSALLVAALVMGERASAQAVRRAYRHSVAELGPEDLYLLAKGAVSENELGHAEHLAVLRTGGYDPYLLRANVEAFAQRPGPLDDAELEELVRVLDRTYLHDFPIDDTDLAYGIAAILAPAGAYAAALRYFEASGRRSERPNTSYNVALCLLHLGRADEAIIALERGVELDPGYEAAATLLAQVREEKSRDEASARRGGSGEAR